MISLINKLRLFGFFDLKWYLRGWLLDRNIYFQKFHCVINLERLLLNIFFAGCFNFLSIACDIHCCQSFNPIPTCCWMCWFFRPNIWPQNAYNTGYSRLAELINLIYLGIFLYIFPMSACLCVVSLLSWYRWLALWHLLSYVKIFNAFFLVHSKVLLEILKIYNSFLCY